MSHAEPTERKRKAPEAKRPSARRPRAETHSTKAPSPAVAAPALVPRDEAVSASLSLSRSEKERILLFKTATTPIDDDDGGGVVRPTPTRSTETAGSHHDPAERTSEAPSGEIAAAEAKAESTPPTPRPPPGRPEPKQGNGVDKVRERAKEKAAWEGGFAGPEARARTLETLASDTTNVLWGPERRRWIAEASTEAHRAPESIDFGDCVVCAVVGRGKDDAPGGLAARSDGRGVSGCSRDAAWDNLLGGKHFGASSFDPSRPGPGLESLVREGMDPYRSRAMALGVYTIEVSVQARELGLLDGSLLERLASRVGGCLIEVGGSSAATAASGSHARTSLACLFAGGAWRALGAAMVDTPMSLRVLGAPKDASFAAHAAPSLSGALRCWASELHGYRGALDASTHRIRVPLSRAGSMDSRESRALTDLMRLSTARREAAIGLMELETYLSDCEVLRRSEGEDYVPDVPLGPMSIGVVPLLGYHARDEGPNERQATLEADLARRSNEAPSLSERLACVRCLGALGFARAARASPWSLFVLCVRLADLVRGMIDLEDPRRVPEGLRPPFRPERDFSAADLPAEELRALAGDTASSTERMARDVVERFERGEGPDDSTSPRAKRGTLDPRSPKPVGLREAAGLDAAVSFRANRKRIPGDKPLDDSATDPRFVATA